MPLEQVFSTDAAAIAFGSGATRELGPRMRGLGCRNVLVVTDARIAALPPVAVAIASLDDAGIAWEVFDRVRVEPTDDSLLDAIAAATAGDFDGFVSIGGGSSIDTAKVANLFSTWPGEFLDYLYPPLGLGKTPPGPLRPHIAIPTTAGTGSETTGNAVFDLPKSHAKNAIAHRVLRPTMGLIDPDNTATMPAMVAASSGIDVLCHALESYTAVAFSDREAAVDPLKRTVYQGANPISDIWSARAIELCAEFLVRAVQDPDDVKARTNMLLASTAAGIGFGNAGVHLPHAMSYPISALARGYVPAGYPDDHAIVPHGISVILTAPAIFRWTASANPLRHLRAAELMGVDLRDLGPEEAGDAVANELVDLMRKVGLPNGLNGVGITDVDLDILVTGTLPQARITQLSPRAASEDDYLALFRGSMTIW